MKTKQVCPLGAGDCSRRAGCWLPSHGGAAVGTGHPSTTSLCDLEQPVDVQGTVSGPLWASGLPLKGRKRAAFPKNKATGNLAQGEKRPVLQYALRSFPPSSRHTAVFLGHVRVGHPHPWTPKFKSGP